MSNESELLWGPAFAAIDGYSGDDQLLGQHKLRSSVGLVLKQYTTMCVCR